MMMDEGRILIIQLRKGSVGEQASRIMGALLFAEIMRAALSRDDIKEKERRPFDCIVDEFQSFITTDIATVLSEARKYRLYLTIANQFLEQIPDNVRPAIFGNAGTYIAFRPGADDAVVLNQQFQGKGPAQFLNLPNFKAWVRPLRDGVPDGPIQIETHPPVPPLHDRAEGLLDNSRMRFGMPREKIEKTIRRLFEA
jgi:hypothetical protein